MSPSTSHLLPKSLKYFRCRVLPRWSLTQLRREPGAAQRVCGPSRLLPGKTAPREIPAEKGSVSSVDTPMTAGEDRDVSPCSAIARYPNSHSTGDTPEGSCGQKGTRAVLAQAGGQNRGQKEERPPPVWPSSCCSGCPHLAEVPHG